MKLKGNFKDGKFSMYKLSENLNFKDKSSLSLDIVFKTDNISRVECYLTPSFIAGVNKGQIYMSNMGEIVYRGVSVCDKDDTFDIDVGQRLALENAMCKFFDDIDKLRDNIAEVASNYIFTGFDSKLQAIKRRKEKKVKNG